MDESTLDQLNQLPPDWHTKPSVARIYDYWLGGYHNFPADRAAAEHLDTIVPDTALRVRANRQFLQRVVQVLAQQGVDQFLDLGSGLPSSGSIHQTAHETQPRARVLYVDSDPVAVIHAQNMLRAEHVEPEAQAIQADIRDTDAILAQARSMLDFSRPVAVLMFAVLHFVPDDAEAARVLDAFRNSCVSGSYLALSHVTHEHLEAEADEFKKYYIKAVSELRTRSTAEVTSFFADWELLPPGVVSVPAWRPDDETILADRPGYSGTLGGVARKP